jgi:hypothetical protein
MKLDPPFYIADIESVMPTEVWVNPRFPSVQIQQLPFAKITDTDQFLELYGKLNTMRKAAEEKARELVECNSKLLCEVQRLKARIHYLTGGAE